MHSGLLVFIWLCAVAVPQFLEREALAGVLLVCAMVASVVARNRSWRLVKRIRFILLAIVLLFAGFTPGEAVFIDWPSLSPSREGLLLAFEHAAKVIVVVLCVAVLMEHMRPDRLVSALYALLRPFEAIGFPADRVAVRILLVLRFVEAEKPPRWHDWLEDDGNDLHDPIEIVRERFNRIDRAVVLALALCIGAVFWWRLG